MNNKLNRYGLEQDDQERQDSQDQRTKAGEEIWSPGQEVPSTPTTVAAAEGDDDNEELINSEDDQFEEADDGDDEGEGEDEETEGR